MVSASQDSAVALVTGSGKKRVGWHVADALAQRGYNLAIHYRSSAQEAAETVAFFQSRGIRAVPLHADLTDEVQVQGLIQRVVEQFGRIDVLANCAAIWKSKKLEEIRAADIRLHFETNLLGTFLCCQQAGLVMVQQKEGGCIVNLGDWAEVPFGLRKTMEVHRKLPRKVRRPNLSERGHLGVRRICPSAHLQGQSRSRLASVQHQASARPASTLGSCPGHRELGGQSRAPRWDLRLPERTR